MQYKRITIIFLWLTCVGHAARSADTLRFAGYDWTVKTGFMGPGPNHWDAGNALVDGLGRLHLRITHHDGQWYGAEVTLPARLGFGRYEWRIDSALDAFDDNVVLGLFNYPTPDVGKDGTNEIDIEFARWGRAQNRLGNFTVWPPQAGTKAGTHAFDFRWKGVPTTHVFDWRSDQVAFETRPGTAGPAVAGSTADREQFTFQPATPLLSIPQNPLVVHLNLWLFHGQPPKDGKEVEVIVSDFRFTAAPAETAPPRGAP